MKREGENFYYERMSFDGQKIGFKINVEVKHEFYRQPRSAWLIPVQKSSDSWPAIHIVDSNELRAIVFEALTPRELQQDSTFMQSLFKNKMKLGSEKFIHPAIASLKPFEPSKFSTLCNRFRQVSDVSFSFFQENVELSDNHPILLISKKAHHDRVANEYARGICNQFKTVLD